MSLLDKLFQHEKSLVGVRAPEFPADMPWINGDALSLRFLRAAHRVTLVDFWTFSCVNCIRTIPHVQRWHDLYAAYGLQVIGIHTPEFAFEQNAAHVATATASLGITYPIVLDNDRRLWSSYANAYWPRKLLIDTTGTIRYDHAGEGAYDETERAIRLLLEGVRTGTVLPPSPDLATADEDRGKACYPRSPEIYLGYHRGHVGNPGDLRPDVPFAYIDVPTHDLHAPYLQGAWTAYDEYAEYGDTTDTYRDYVSVSFNGSEVNAVMHAADGQPTTLQVTIDGNPVGGEDAGADITVSDNGDSFITIREPRMYRILNSQQQYMHADLRLFPRTPGLRLYSYTFGSQCK